MSKPVKAWCIKGPRGKLIPKTCSGETRLSSWVRLATLRADYMTDMREWARSMERLGYKAVRVVVAEVTP